MSDPLVRFQEVQLGYGRQVVLENVQLDIFRGDFFGLVGPNGSGKTTLLRSLLGILKPLRGQVARAVGLRIGYVPQREMLDPLFPLTALDIVLMGRYPCAGVFRLTPKG
jgi:zinc transport system ATP-binding protein